jgi:hypothetical protein
MDAMEIFEPLSEDRPGTARVYREKVMAALQGAARRGWLGPLPGSERRSDMVGVADRTLELDLLALSVKAAIERVALPLARAARALCETRAWATFGYARIEDNARERLGRTGRRLRDHAALGRSLESHPSLADALCGSDGGRPLGKVSALWVGRVASADSVGAWIDLARAVSVRELKEIVRQALRADSDSPPSGGGCGRRRR